MLGCPWVFQDPHDDHTPQFIYEIQLQLDHMEEALQVQRFRLLSHQGLHTDSDAKLGTWNIHKRLAVGLTMVHSTFSEHR